MVVISDETEAALKFRRDEEKENRAKQRESTARGNHYRAKFRREQARRKAFYDGKEVSFPFSFEFSTRFGKFKIEESGKAFDSKAMAIQSCRARLRKWWRKRNGSNLPGSLSIRGRKCKEDDNGLTVWQLWVYDNSTARQFSDDPLLPPKLPNIGERKDTYKETLLVPSK
jgi:hypothetical protein